MEGKREKKAIAHFKAQRGYKMSDHAGSKKKKGIKQMRKTMMMEMENGEMKFINQIQKLNPVFLVETRRAQC